jgi:glycerophosphoryl diester phosphodiesterase
MTGAEGRLRDRTAADLGALKLAGTDETIPTLREALVEIGHRAMVHIELKTPFGEVGPLERRVHEIIADHAGPLCIIGFNPYSHAWFADRYPGVLRGLDSYSWDRAPHLAEDQRRAFAALEHVEIARPHFLALGLDMLPSARAAEMRAEGMPVIAWTVREPAQWERVKAGCDNLIFEGFAA